MFVYVHVLFRFLAFCFPCSRVEIHHGMKTFLICVEYTMNTLAWNDIFIRLCFHCIYTPPYLHTYIPTYSTYAS